MIHNALYPIKDKAELEITQIIGLKFRKNVILVILYLYSSDIKILFYIRCAKIKTEPKMIRVKYRFRIHVMTKVAGSKSTCQSKDQ